MVRRCRHQHTAHVHGCPTAPRNVALASGQCSHRQRSHDDPSTLKRGERHPPTDVRHHALHIDLHSIHTTGCTGRAHRAGKHGSWTLPCQRAMRHPAMGGARRMTARTANTASVHPSCRPQRVGARASTGMACQARRCRPVAARLPAYHMLRPPPSSPEHLLSGRCACSACTCCMHTATTMAAPSPQPLHPPLR